MKHKVGVPVVAQVRRVLNIMIRMHTDIKRTYRNRDRLYVGNSSQQLFSRAIAGNKYVASCAFICAFNMLQRAINYRLRHSDMSRYICKINQDKWNAELVRILLRSLLPEDTIEQFINYMEGANTK